MTINLQDLRESNELLNTILDRLGRGPITALVSGVHAEVARYLSASKPDDDISLLGIEYMGSTLDRG